MSVVLSVVMEIPGKETRQFEYEFDQDCIRFGRDEDNDIQIPLATVSRHHLELLREGKEWFLQDLNSTHGTNHNGQPVGKGAKKLIRSGDVLEIVHFRITFSLKQGTASFEMSKEETEARNRRLVEEILVTLGSDEMPYLRVMNGPDEGRKFELGPDITEAVMGRGADCDFQINDANISRQHAKVKRDWTEITIEDMGSKNGVCIGDEQILKPSPLRDADEIMLGAVRLTFIDPSAKFLGKLDDIPAFAQATSAIDVAEGDLESSPDLDAVVDGAPDDDHMEPPPAESDQLDAVPNDEQSDLMAPPGENIDEPGNEEGEENEESGLNEAESAEPVKRKSMSTFDLLMIAFVVLVAIAGAGFIYFLLMEPVS